MTRPAAYLDLRELALRPGGVVERDFDLEIAPVSLGGSSYVVVLHGPGVGVRVRRIAGGHLIRVAVDATVYGPCSRCLDEAALQVTTEQEEFAPTHPEEWEEGEVSPFIEGLVVDVAGLAREALVLALPSKILCHDSCAGLCPSCGSVAHSAQCECALSPPDDRWAGLAHLRITGGAED